MDALELKPTVIIMDPEDGLPRPVDEDGLAEAPIKTLESFLCMADERSYVEIFSDEYGTTEHQPLELRQGMGVSSRLRYNMIGTKILLVTRTRYDEHGAPVKRFSWPAGRERSRFGQTYVEIGSETDLTEIGTETDPAPGLLDVIVAVFAPLVGAERAGHAKRHDERPAPPTPREAFEAFVAFVKGGGRVLLPVRPMRRACEHYKSALFAVADSPGKKIRFPWCTAIRSVGGAYMSLADEAVYACQFRSPPDPDSTEKHLDRPEREGVSQPVVRLPLWERFQKTDAEVAAEAVTKAGSVFRPGSG